MNEKLAVSLDPLTNGTGTYTIGRMIRLENSTRESCNSRLVEWFKSSSLPPEMLYREAGAPQ